MENYNEKLKKYNMERIKKIKKDLKFLFNLHGFKYRRSAKSFNYLNKKGINKFYYYEGNILNVMIINEYDNKINIKSEIFNLHELGYKQLCVITCPHIYDITSNFSLSESKCISYLNLDGKKNDVININKHWCAYEHQNYEGINLGIKK